MRPKLSNLKGNTVTLQRLNSENIDRVRSEISYCIKEYGEPFDMDVEELAGLKEKDKELRAEIITQLSL